MLVNLIFCIICIRRYLSKLKNNVRNKTRVEGSICNAYLVEEASLFCFYYFEDHVTIRHINVPHNYDGRGDVRDDHPDNLSIFKHVGRPLEKVSRRFLEDEEYNATHIYVLLNCSEVEPYINQVSYYLFSNTVCSYLYIHKFYFF